MNIQSNGIPLQNEYINKLTPKHCPEEQPVKEQSKTHTQLDKTMSLLRAVRQKITFIHFIILCRCRFSPNL